jgi:hypothetical protein
MFRASLCPSSGEQECALPHLVFCTLVLLMMGIMMPETCWDKSFDNKHQISCILLVSLSSPYVHDARSQEPKNFTWRYICPRSRDEMCIWSIGGRVTPVLNLGTWWRLNVQLHILAAFSPEEASRLSVKWEVKWDRNQLGASLYRNTVHLLPSPQPNYENN